MSNNLRGKYAIVGVGQSKLGKVPDLGPIGLFTVAAKNAIEDAGLSKTDVDGLITRGPDDVYCHHQLVGKALGVNVTFSTSTDNGGASQ
ncbi:MAG: thiolase family protein, partial [Candidatus Binatia bacterium]